MPGKKENQNKTVEFLTDLQQLDKNGQRMALGLSNSKKYIKEHLYSADHPIAGWAPQMVLGRIRNAQREAGIGSIGWFEASDRVRNFKNRMQLADSLTQEYEKVVAQRLSAFEKAGTVPPNQLPADVDRITQKQDRNLAAAVAFWFPYLSSLKQAMKQQNQNFETEYPSLGDSRKILDNVAKGDSQAQLLDMLQIIEDTDMEEFAYTDNATFARNFSTKYEKLKALAQGEAMIDYIRSQNNGAFASRREQQEGNEDSTKTCEAKCRMASQLLKDYEVRFRLVTSPFYAMLAGKDIDKVSTTDLRKQKDNTTNVVLKDYLDDVITYRRQKRSTLKSVNLTSRLYTYVRPTAPALVYEPLLESGQILGKIDNLINTMYLDTRRSSGYKKVRQALKTYKDTIHGPDLTDALTAVAAAADVYLDERSKSSYANRAERCTDLLELIEKYKQAVAEEAKEQEEVQRPEPKIEESDEIKAEELRQDAPKIDKEKQNEKPDEQAKEEKEEQPAKPDEQAKEEKIEQPAKEEDPEEVRRLEQERLEEARRLERERLERIERERAHRVFTESAAQAVEQFNALAQQGKTAPDSANARQKVLDFYQKYIFTGEPKSEDELTFESIAGVPTVMLVDALKEYMTRMDEADYADKIKAYVSKRQWEEATHEEFRKPMVDISNKKSFEVTEQDRLMLYEYSVYLLKKIGDLDDLKFGDLADWDLVKLSALAVHAVNLDESYVDEDKGEKLEDMNPDQKQKHINEAAAVLGQLSGKSEELFRYLPLADLSEGAFDALENLTDPKELKITLDKCVRQATEIKERSDLLMQALEVRNKKTLIESIQKLTGNKKDDLDLVPTDDLITIASHMLDHVQHKDEMLQSYETFKNTFLGRSGEYYREKFLELETSLRKDKLAPEEKITPEEKIARRDYAYSYVRKMLGADAATAGSVYALDDQTLYGLVSDMGVILYLNQSVAELNAGQKGAVRVREVLSSLSKEQYEAIGMNVDDYDKAVKRLKALKLDKGLGNSVNSILKPQLPPMKMVDMGKDVDQEYAAQAAIEFSVGPEIAKYRNSRNRGKKKREQKPMEAAGQKEQKQKKKNQAWSKDAEGLLKVVSGLYLESAQKPMDAKRITRLIRENSNAFQQYMTIPLNDPRNPYTELINGLAGQEKAFIEGTASILSAIAENCKTVSSANPQYNGSLKEMLKKHRIVIDWNKAGTALDRAADKAEKDIVRMMKEATDDCFDVIGGMGILSLWYDDDDAIEADRNTLLFSLNQERYNSKAGQGKFLQTLMNDYYTESSFEDRRFMLSYIIGDFKKNDHESTEKKKGGEYFASSLKGAGPLMQKMMQGIPENMVVPELRDAMNIVRSDLRPIDSDHVKKTINDIVNGSNEKITSIKLDNRLGAASVAETFSCTVEGPKIGKKEAVIKILRPDAKDKMKRELPLIRRSAMYADMTVQEEAQYRKELKKAQDNAGLMPKRQQIGATEAGFLAQYTEIEKEFNLENEAANCKKGAEKYKDDKGEVKSVELIDVPMGENYLLMSKAEGITLDRFVKQADQTGEDEMGHFAVKQGKNQVSYRLNRDNMMYYADAFSKIYKNGLSALDYHGYVCRIARLWTNEALFGSAWSLTNKQNFRHGDLHSGNIMVEQDKGATILDYGNASSLHHDKVTHILQMLIGVVIKREDFYMEAFQNFLKLAVAEDAKSKNPIGYRPMTKQQAEEYRKRTKEIFNTGLDENAGIKITMAFSTAQSLGIKLPIELQNFCQCQQRLENSINEIKQTAFEQRKRLDKILRMKIDPKLEHSLDPRVILQKRMLEEDEKEQCGYEDEWKTVCKLRSESLPKNILEWKDNLIDLMKEKKRKGYASKVETFIKKNYRPYDAFSTTVIDGKPLRAEDIPRLAEKWRQDYKKVIENIKLNNGQMSNEDRMALAPIDSFFKIGQYQGLFEFESTDSIVELTDKAFKPPYSDTAFEKLMTILEVDVAQVANNKKSLENFLMNSSPKELEGKGAENKLPEEVKKAFMAVRCESLKQKRLSYNFVYRLRNLFWAEEGKSVEEKIASFKEDLGQLFADNKQLFPKSQQMEEVLEIYIENRLEYDKLTDKDSREDFKTVRQNLIRAENALVKYYAGLCQRHFDKMIDAMGVAFSMDKIARRKDYVDIIYDVFMDNKNRTNTLKRVGWKVKKAFDNYEKQAKAEAEKNEINEHKPEEKKDDKKAEKIKDFEAEGQKVVIDYHPKASFDAVSGKAKPHKVN